MARVAGLPPRKALTLAVLMNTKGLVELIVLNIGLSKGVINQQTFTLMVLMALFTTFISSPIVSCIYSPEQDVADMRVANANGKKKRKDGFRLMTCLTGMRSVPPMVMLIETVKGQHPQAAQVHCVHLIELSERPSAFMSIQTQRKEKILSDPLSLSLESFGRVNRVSITPLLTISSPKDMHEDILGLAEREGSTLLVLPYHEHSPSDRLLDFSRINVVAGNVLQTVHCSVGLMVDLGLRRPFVAQLEESSSAEDHISQSAYRVVVLFFGGPDDREALALGARMCTNPNVQLTVVRLIVTDLTPVDLVLPVTESCERLPLGGAVQEDDQGKDEALFKYITGETSPFKSKVEVETRRVGDPLAAALQVANTFVHHVLIVGRSVQHPPAALRQVHPKTEANSQHLGPVGAVVVGPERTPGSLCSSPIVLVMQQAPQENPFTVESKIQEVPLVRPSRSRSPFTSSSTHVMEP
eukprot:TRINITY_DN8078_c0_g1_i2.p1 TRINITY_DN8078_c0_g1~~TRINITY_DN8078_c0_g1_i2.p1  ORF type:complete len:469 (+),score=80.82 TRINITY_DN8078_c0_g1_i2:1052-2458(+)